MLHTMGQRRDARERAIQFLFQMDLNPPEALDEAFEHLWQSQRLPAIEGERGVATWGQKTEMPAPSEDELKMRAFALKLVRGVLEHRDDLDARIKKYTQNWEFNRIAVVDRNILRLAIYEMLYRDDIPPVVSINEAIEIAKKFSTDDSGGFVNGILDRIKEDLMRPARTCK
jgi:transcription antitermination protein NusB